MSSSVLACWKALDRYGSTSSMRRTSFFYHNTIAPPCFTNLEPSRTNSIATSSTSSTLNDNDTTKTAATNTMRRSCNRSQTRHSDGSPTHIGTSIVVDVVARRKTRRDRNRVRQDPSTLRDIRKRSPPPTTTSMSVAATTSASRQQSRPRLRCPAEQTSFRPKQTSFRPLLRDDRHGRLRPGCGSCIRIRSETSTTDTATFPITQAVFQYDTTRNDRRWYVPGRPPVYNKMAPFQNGLNLLAAYEGFAYK